MNVNDEIKNIRLLIAEANRLLMGIRRGGGETNTASNQGVGGVGLYDGKVAADLQFRNINVGSDKVTVTLDAPNKEVDIDIVPANVDLGDLGDVSAAAPNDDDILTWDAGGATWQPEAAAGGGSGAENLLCHRRVGRYYSSDAVGTQTCGADTIPMDQIYGVPFVVPVSQDFDRIAIYAPAGTANGVARLGIYEDGGDVYPGDLIVGTAELDLTDIGVKEAVIAETLTPGLYWLAIVSDGDSNVTINRHYGEGRNCVLFPILGWKAGLVTAPGVCLYTAQAYGAMPDPFPAINGETEETSYAPAIYLRRA